MNSPADEPPVFTDDQMDVVAQIIVDLRAEWRADIAEAVAKLGDQMDVYQTLGELRGQLSVLIGGEKSIEASEVIRKLKVTNRE